MTSIPDLRGQLAIPVDDTGPTFAAPWQAQAFVMAVTLHDAGCFTWPEWADRLAGEIERAQRAGDPDLGDTYYDHWLRTLEIIVSEKALVTTEELRGRRDEWEAAAAATPHGEPIVLDT